MILVKAFIWENQAKGLIYIDPEPMLYTVNLKLSEIPNDKILVLEGMDLVYAVLANARKERV